jgi:hypothetical protein
MEKEAQRRSVTKSIGRAINPAEWFRNMSGEYREVSQLIDEIDKDMRDKALQNDPGMREAIHEARMAMKNREFPKTFYYAWQLIKAVEGIFTKDIHKLERLSKRIINEFYAESLTPSQLRELHRNFGQGSKEIKVPKNSNLEVLLYAAAAPELISEGANPVQWLQENIPSYRQLKGDLLDRIFRNRMGKQKEAARLALSVAEKAYKSIKEVFSKLDSARRDFSTYISIAQKYQERFEALKEELSVIYQEHFSDLVPSNKPEKKEQKTEQSRKCWNCGANAVAGAPCSECGAEEMRSAEAPPAVPVVESPQPAGTKNPNPGPLVDNVTVPNITNKEEEEKTKAAELIVELVSKARNALEQSDRGLAAALLAKASEICDDYGNEEESIVLLKAASDLMPIGE